MRFRFIYVCVIFLFCLGSCTFFKIEKVNPDEVLERERLGLLKGGLGEYPLFDTCKNRVQTEEQKKCFQQELCEHIASYLEQQAFYIEGIVLDTLWIPLLIDSTGTVTVEGFDIPDFIADQEPSLSVLLEESVESLPELGPAHVRGVPVTTRYRLPLVLTTE